MSALNILPILVFLVLVLFVAPRVYSSFTKNSGVIVFLDSEQRPGAIAITSSAAQVATLVSSSLNGFRFTGGLGAIQGQANYVGFTGLELKASLFYDDSVTQDPASQDQFKMKIANISPIPSSLTVQLVTKSMEGFSKTYSYEFLVTESAVDLLLNRSDFKLSFRGAISDSPYEGDEPVDAVRVFFKRSKNQPQSTEFLPVSFDIITDDLLMGWKR